MARRGLAETIIGRGSALVVATVKGVVKGMLRSVFSMIGKERVHMFIDNDWHILDVVLNAFTAPEWRYPEGLSREEIERLEALRHRLGPVVRMTLQMVRGIAKQLPRNMVERLDGSWLLRRIREVDAELASVIEAHPKGLEWLEKEAERLREWLLS